MSQIVVPALNGTCEHFSLRVCLAPFEAPIRLLDHGFIFRRGALQDLGLQGNRHDPNWSKRVSYEGVALHIDTSPLGPKREHLIVEKSDGEDREHHGEKDASKCKVRARDSKKFIGNANPSRAFCSESPLNERPNEEGDGGPPQQQADNRLRLLHSPVLPHGPFFEK